MNSLLSNGKQRIKMVRSIGKLYNTTMETKHLPMKFFFIFLCLGMLSCRSKIDDVKPTVGNATVQLVLMGTSFDDIGTLGTQAAIPRSLTALVPDQIEQVLLEGNEEYSLIATLSPVSSTVNSDAMMLTASSALTKNKSATTTVTNPLGEGIRYKVAVFDVAGNYVEEQDFTSGQNTTDITQLNGGSTYTFVVYSIGSSTDLPPIIYSDPSKKTLATASVNNISGDSDLMYYTYSMMVTGNEINYLNIVLKHKYSRIVTTLDASATGYAITGIDRVTIAPQSESSNMQLSNSHTTGTGLSGSKIVSFPTLGSGVVTSQPVLINCDDTTTGSLSIKSITMNTGGNLNATITHQNVIFNNLKITRGIEYSLKLAFVPNDMNLVYGGYPAVKINGFVWMRHNLGADISADPDIPSQAIVGNYYQWGRIDAVANANTPEGAIVPWRTSPIPGNYSWNASAEESTPIKTANDPCPAGWRVPTGREYITLYANVKSAKIGDNTNAATNFRAASVLTSSRNGSVKLTFPSTGYRRSTDGALIGRGSSYTYWNSVREGTNNAYSARVPDFDIYNRNSAQPVRCVADSPIDSSN